MPGQSYLKQAEAAANATVHGRGRAGESSSSVMRSRAKDAVAPKKMKMVQHMTKRYTVIHESSHKKKDLK